MTSTPSAPARNGTPGTPATAAVPTAPPRATAWDEPAGVNPRGTLVVIPGRGEHPGAYERFGRRLAADAYRVRIADSPARAAELLAAADTPGPRVLVGADTGALHAVALATGTARGPDALILAGLPTGPATIAPVPAGLRPADPGTADPTAAERDAELAVRSGCPAYHALLDRDGYRPGALTEPVPAYLLADADLAAVTVPVLALHGSDDTVVPLDAARRAYQQADVHLVVLEEARHDVLNDVSHRTAAATVVLFLERLRLSPELPRIARTVLPLGDPA